MPTIVALANFTCYRPGPQADPLPRGVQTVLRTAHHVAPRAAVVVVAALVVVKRAEECGEFC
jgi:hypothetical protein